MSDDRLATFVLFGASLLILAITFASQRVMLPGINRDRDEEPFLFWLGVTVWACMAAMAIYLILARA